jgi:hypothetical protein
MGEKAGKGTGMRARSSTFAYVNRAEGGEKGLTNSRLYGNFRTERNNRNDRHYKTYAFARSSKIHLALGRNGHPVGH